MNLNPPETAASGTEAGIDQNNESLIYSLHRRSATCHGGAPY